MNRIAPTFRTLQEEVIWLRDRVAELEAEKADREKVAEIETVAVARAYNVNISQARILRLLSTGHAYNRHRIMAEYTDDDLEMRNVDSQIKRIRQRVASLTINNLYGFGYQLEPSSAATVRKIMADAREVRPQSSSSHIGAQH